MDRVSSAEPVSTMMTSSTFPRSEARLPGRNRSSSRTIMAAATDIIPTYPLGAPINVSVAIAGKRYRPGHPHAVDRKGYDLRWFISGDFSQTLNRLHHGCIDARHRVV